MSALKAMRVISLLATLLGFLLLASAPLYGQNDGAVGNSSDDSHDSAGRLALYGSAHGWQHPGERRDGGRKLHHSLGGALIGEHSGRNGAIVHEATAALLYDEGSYAPPISEPLYLSPLLQHNESRESRDSLWILPGDNLYLGYRNDNRWASTTLAVGRFAPAPIEDLLSGANGSRSGIHLRLEHRLAGAITITPIHRPALTGSYLSLDGLGRLDPALLERAGAERRLDLRKVSLRQSDHGRRVSYSGGYGPFRLAIWIDRQIQEESARHPAVEQLRRDQLDYQGIGWGWVGGDPGRGWHLLLAVERVEGEVHAVVRNLISERGRRVLGHAASLDLLFERPRFYLRTTLFLPRSDSPREGKMADGEEYFGYVGYGNVPLTTPLLGGVLRATPYPQLCGTSPHCRTLDRGRDTFAFADHAGTAQLQGGFSFSDYSLSLMLAALVPLAEDDNARRSNPLARLHPDQGQESLIEAAISLSYHYKAKSSATITFARVERYHRVERRRRMVSEALFISIQSEIR